MHVVFVCLVLEVQLILDVFLLLLFCLKTHYLSPVSSVCQVGFNTYMNTHWVLYRPGLKGHFYANEVKLLRQRVKQSQQRKNSIWSF